MVSAVIFRTSNVNNVFMVSPCGNVSSNVGKSLVYIVFQVGKFVYDHTNVS